MAWLRELKLLPRLIIGGYNLNDVRETNDTVLMAATKPIEELREKVA